MNKSELIKMIAQEAEVSEQLAGKVLNATLKVMEEALRCGEKPTVLARLLQAKTPTPATRTGRNPRAKAVPKASLRIKTIVKQAPKPAAKLSGNPTGGGGPGKKR